MAIYRLISCKEARESLKIDENQAFREENGPLSWMRSAARPWSPWKSRRRRR